MKESRETSANRSLEGDLKDLQHFYIYANIHDFYRNDVLLYITAFRLKKMLTIPYTFVHCFYVEYLILATVVAFYIFYILQVMLVTSVC